MRQDKKVRQDRKIKRVFPVTWWKVIPGGILIGIGLIAGAFYLDNSRNLLLGFLTVITLAPGALLAYMGLKQGEAGFSFNKRKYTGNENAILIIARRNKDTNKDVPSMIMFAKLKRIPKGARLHYVRNVKKHFYELLFNTETKKLEPVILPDKKSFPPELYKIPATMQPYKDYMEYCPASLLQKVAPGILLGAMGIVGLLMVITGD